MRNRFDEQLAQLNRELIEMGAMCEEAIAVVAKALIDGDTNVTGKSAAIENDINQKERSIESKCLKLLLQQQPVARDLRQISAALKMITDMERIGVQASDIAEIVGYLGGKACVECGFIGDMARAAIKMVTDSIDAFVKYDIQKAEAVIKYDDVVDELFTKTKLSLIGMITSNSRNAEYAIDLIMIAKYIERIADHTVNIAEWVMFSVTGVHKGAGEL